MIDLRLILYKKGFDVKVLFEDERKTGPQNFRAKTSRFVALLIHSDIKQ